MKKLCIISTVELPIRFFMIPHLKALQQFYELTAILDTDQPDFLKDYGIDATVIPLSIRRNISLFHDFFALISLILLFRRNKFHIIHSIAPKAGLLAMLAGFFACIPIRMHCFTGQVWVNDTGLRRFILKLVDRLTAVSATHILTDSHSQRDFLIREQIVSEHKIKVLANGSVSGVDLERFRPDATARTALRLKLKIPHDALLCLYLGRMKRDKGVLDLAKAATRVLAENATVYLLFVGPDEDGLKGELSSLLVDYNSQVRFEEYTDIPEAFMASADILCLPSYREGFGMVILEAAAVGIPALASRIYGITDAVEDGITGLLHAPYQIDEIASMLSTLVTDPNLLKVMGERAQQRARELFSQQLVVSAMLNYYRSMERELKKFSNLHSL